MPQMRITYEKSCVLNNQNCSYYRNHI